MERIDDKTKKELEFDLDIEVDEVGFHNPKPGMLNLYRKPLIGYFFDAVVLLMLYSYYEVAGWEGFYDLLSWEGLRTVGVAIGVGTFVNWVLMKTTPCRQCECGSKKFKVQYLGSSHVCTTPTTASGHKDRRYNESGYDKSQYMFTCQSCGGHHYDSKVE